MIMFAMSTGREANDVWPAFEQGLAWPYALGHP